MRIWLVAAAEPIPSIDLNYRDLRCGMLARELVTRGHEVRWWTSTFDHMAKKHRYAAHTTVTTPEGVHIHLMYAVGYKRNVSVSRVIHNRRLARSFGELSALLDLPAVVFACLPTLELAEAATTLAQGQHRPCIVDVRDKWPDVYLSAIPRPARSLAQFALSSEWRRARRALRAATHLTAVSDAYLDWGLGLAERQRTPMDRVFSLGYPAPRTDPCDEASGDPSNASSNGVKPLVFTFVGTFGTSYDLASTVDAARRLAERAPGRTHFVLAGDGDQGNSIRRRCSDLANVELTGWLDQSSLRRLLQASSVGLVAYARNASQTLPNKPFEYWAHGLPVLCSLRGELAELVTKERVGLTYRPGDVDDLVRAVTYCVEHPDEVSAMGERASRLFRGRFSESVVYPQLADYIEAVGAE